LRELPERDVAERSAFKGKTGLARLFKAFLHSCDGLAAAFRHESAFRQALVLAAILIPTSLFLPVTPVECALLIASMLLVLVVELLNTGIEAAIDRISFEQHPLSKRAKDAGSAAVMLSLVLLGSVWAVILLPKLA
jgi:diacylglycerol kinase (ATP)